MKRTLDTFAHAFRGLYSFATTERNAVIHLVLSCLAIALGLFFGIKPNQWLWLATAITAVLVAELFNTAIERLCDRITREHDAEIKIIKDIGAAAVLLTAIFALFIGGMIFLPLV